MKTVQRKIKVGIIFGGKSAEHEVSLRSAENIVRALDRSKYEPILIGITKKGQWLLPSSSQLLLGNANDTGVMFAPESHGTLTTIDHTPIKTSVDVIFPVLHGTFGEDGTVQGLLKLANIPFVGAGVLGSAVGMDKDIMKRLLRDAGIPGAKYLLATEKKTPSFSTVTKSLGLPVFIKPANLGSSVGVSKVKNKNEYNKALKEAFSFDRKILIEECIDGREIECSVLGNDEPIASIPGEVKPSHEFYSYDAKYTDEHGAIIEIPAHLPKNTVKKIQTLAVKTFQTLNCEGMARVDFFLKKNGDVLVNEINTIPGFTSISMYPKLWEASGLSYTKLITRLIELAFERFEKEKNLKTSYSFK